MKLTTFLTGTLLACVALAQYNITSKPFHLQLRSDDKNYNGAFLYSCHEGAAIEALCVGNTTIGPDLEPSATFHFNTSYYDTTFNATLGEPGYVTWVLPSEDFALSEPLGLSFDATSDLALPLFEPGDEGTTLMAFDADDRLNIQGYVDDTVVPATADDTRAYYRWYACQTYYSGYRYTALEWLVGDGTPENPSCCKVDVERHFVAGK